jgi:hypothetical protein
MSDTDDDWDKEFEDGDQEPNGNPAGVKRSLPVTNLSSFADSDEDSLGEELDGAVLADTLKRKFGIPQKASLPGQLGDTKKPTLITPEMLAKYLEPAAPAPASVAAPSPKVSSKETPLAGTKAPRPGRPSEVEVKKLPRLDLSSETGDSKGDATKKRRSNGSLDSPQDTEDSDRSSDALLQSLKNIKQVAQHEAKSVTRLEQNFNKTDGDIKQLKEEAKSLKDDVNSLRQRSKSTTQTDLKNRPESSTPASRTFLQILFLALVIVAVAGGAFFLYATKQRQDEENTFEVRSGL